MASLGIYVQFQGSKTKKKKNNLNTWGSLHLFLFSNVLRLRFDYDKHCESNRWPPVFFSQIFSDFGNAQVRENNKYIYIYTNDKKGRQYSNLPKSATKTAPTIYSAIPFKTQHPAPKYPKLNDLKQLYTKNLSSPWFSAIFKSWVFHQR